METRPPGRRFGLLYALCAVAILAATFAAGTAVMAQSGTTIFGCKTDAGGLLRVVVNPNNCKGNETPITWNRQGPRGPQGQPPAFVRGEQAGSVSTSNTAAYQALGGPRVTVNVPASRYVEVGASALTSGDSGAVALFDVASNTAVPGQSELCADVSGTPPNNSGLLFSSPPSGADQYTMSTPAGSPNVILNGACGNTGGPSTVLLGPLSPGRHTLEMRYVACGCQGGPANFSERRLWARPAP